MNEDRTYYIYLKIGIEFTGDEIPDEESIIMPVKNFIKKHMRAYKNTCRIVVMDSKIAEAGYDQESVPEEP